MSERRERVISEIKEVAERIEVKLGEYRTKYYKEIPVESIKKIFKWLKSANILAEIVDFETEIQKYMYFSESRESNIKTYNNITNIHNCLENVVNEVLNYYDNKLVDFISNNIRSMNDTLIRSGYKVESELRYLVEKLDVSRVILLYENKYSNIIELKEIISIISDIDSIRPCSLVPEIHELYGIKAILLQLEEDIKIIETIENSSCINVILAYIDQRINWKWIKDIR